MKNTITILALFILVALVFSCNKGEDVVSVQDPLNGYLSASGFNQNINEFTGGQNQEFGYSFVPLVNGKITAIVVKLPLSNQTLRVTIWNKTTGNVLRATIIDVSNGNKKITQKIIPLTLFKDNEYFITMNSRDYYRHTKIDESNVVYPIIVGDIKITSYAYKMTATQSIPTINLINNYSGDCSFKFQK